MSQTIKKEKQKKSLLKMVGRLYKKDLEEVLAKFYASKKGSKTDLKQRVIEFIESDKQDIDFEKLKKEIKSVYKSNSRIKKSPKKAKSSKSSNKVKTSAQQMQDMTKVINDCARGTVERLSDESTDSQLIARASEEPKVPILRIPKPLISSEVVNRTLESVKTNDNFSTLSFNNFQSTAGASDNLFEQFSHLASGRPPLTSQSQPQQTSSVGPHLTFPSDPSFSSNYYNSFSIYRNNNINQSHEPNAYSMSGIPPPVPPLNMAQNSVPNPQLIRPPTNPYNGSAQPINYSINNYFQTPPQNFTFQQNFYPNQNQNPVSDVLNPQNLDSFIAQQKFLLSQYPKSFQSEDDKESTESESPITDFVFKSLPKFKAIKTLKEIQTIGSLSDIGVEVVFDLKPTDLEPNYFQNNMSDGLKGLLDKKGLKVLLRFSYISDVNSRKQKDSLPEHLCIECNNQNIFTYEEGSEDMSGPFDLSDYSVYYQNRVKFFMSSENYTSLLPCIYEISIVKYETCDSFLSKLKENSSQFLYSESTKQMIRSRSGQSSQDEVISINTDIKLRLICPLSCRRMETPCRTSDCKHIECFDAFTFFKTNESRYDWFCPICQKSAQFERLRIDGYITDVLNSTDDNIIEIFIKPDASYDVIQKKESIVIELDDSDSEEIECIENSVIDADGCIVLD